MCGYPKSVPPPRALDDLRNLGLTQFFGKLIEMMVIALLDPFLNGDKTQFGGQKNTGTGHYLIELTDFILEAWETPTQAVVMLCADFSKGFNRIHPVRLITTFSDMGIPIYLLKILISYMTGRVMKVRHNGAWSREHKLPGGSPQGGLLSIIIFCIYTTACGMRFDEALKSEIPENFPILPSEESMRDENEIRAKYVDDTSLAVKLMIDELLKEKGELIVPEFMFEDKTTRELTNFEMNPCRNTMMEKIEDIEQAVRLNFMKLNEKKSKILFFNNKKKDGVMKFQCNGKDLEQVEEIKLIGFHFQSNMGIDVHVNAMKNKVNKRIWALRRLMANEVRVEDGKKFYISMVRSILEVNVEVWNGRLNKRNVHDLERLQAKCLRIILRKKYTSYELALKQLKLETLEERRKKLCLNFVTKAAKNHPDLYPAKEIPRNTRLGAKRPLAIPKFKTEKHKNSGKVYLARLYNDNLQTISEDKTLPEKVTVKKRGRCGNCEKCKMPNCGVCKFCKDMKLFGGKNKLKQSCIHRKCLI